MERVQALRRRSAPAALLRFGMGFLWLGAQFWNFPVIAPVFGPTSRWRVAWRCLPSSVRPASIRAGPWAWRIAPAIGWPGRWREAKLPLPRSEEHTSELQSRL